MHAAAMRRDPVLQPAQTAAELVDRAADAVVGDPDDQLAVGLLGAQHNAGRVGVFDRVGQALAGDEVRRRFQADAESLGRGV